MKKFREVSFAGDHTAHGWWRQDSNPSLCGSRPPAFNRSVVLAMTQAQPVSAPTPLKARQFPQPQLASPRGTGSRPSQSHLPGNPGPSQLGDCCIGLWFVISESLRTQPFRGQFGRGQQKQNVTLFDAAIPPLESNHPWARQHPSTDMCCRRDARTDVHAETRAASSELGYASPRHP